MVMRSDKVNIRVYYADENSEAGILNLRTEVFTFCCQKRVFTKFKSSVFKALFTHFGPKRRASERAESSNKN